MMQKILIIEDDPAIRDELSLLLTNEGCQTAVVEEFASVPVQVQRAAPDLILLDLNLSGRDGLALCADIRKVRRTPIIFVTSRDSAADELHKNVRQFHNSLPLSRLNQGQKYFPCSKNMVY